MSKKLCTYLLLILTLVFGGCSEKSQQIPLKKPELQSKGTLVYQNKNIYGFKIAPDQKKMLVVIDDAIVIYDFEKMKPTLRFREEGLNSAPTNIYWAPDSKKATIIFTGNINRMLFIDLTKKGHIYDLYAKNLIDLAWVDNKNLFYKINGESEAIFKLEVFSKEPQLLTALRPGENPNTKMLLLNAYNGFILKKDDIFSAVKADKLAQPIELANLNFRQSKGFLTRNILLEDKNEDGILLRKYGFIRLKEKVFILDNSLIFLNMEGQTLALQGIRGRMLGKSIVIKKEDNSVVLFDVKTTKETPLPGKWSNYQYSLQSDFWYEKNAVLLKNKLSKDGKPVSTITLYKLSS